ncbi:MAG: hypothetical protein OXI96_09425, partial [Acidimicrobiaceae bacterium]|nr:hypothetical protein [Acidimicrobiaceae bacterium]
GPPPHPPSDTTYAKHTPSKSRRLLVVRITDPVDVEAFVGSPVVCPAAVVATPAWLSTVESPVARSVGSTTDSCGPEEVTQSNYPRTQGIPTPDRGFRSNIARSHES